MLMEDHAKIIATRLEGKKSKVAQFILLTATTIYIIVEILEGLYYSLRISKCLNSTQRTPKEFVVAQYDIRTRQHSRRAVRAAKKYAQDGADKQGITLDNEHREELAIAVLEYIREAPHDSLAVAVAQCEANTSYKPVGEMQED